MNFINRIMIALLLLALLYALYKYQQSYNISSQQVDNLNNPTTPNSTNVANSSSNTKAAVNARKESQPNAKDNNDSKKVVKKVQFEDPRKGILKTDERSSNKSDLIDDDSIDLDNISQMSLGSLNSNNTNLSLDTGLSLDSSYSASNCDSLFDNLSLESRESKDSFFFA
jgi:hypothetical protein